MSIRSGWLMRDSGDQPQHEFDKIRGHLMLGRGSGASAQEVAAHTRCRLSLGGVPTGVALELAQLHANMARRNAAAIADDGAKVRADLVETLDEFVARVAPWLVGAALLAVFGLGLLVDRGWRCRPRRRATRASRAAPIA